MLSLYKSLVRPHVEYCISAWNPHYKEDKELIEKVQRRFTKMINNMEGKSYEERLYCLKVWTLEEQYTVSQKSEPPKHFATATANLHRFK